MEYDKLKIDWLYTTIKTSISKPVTGGCFYRIVHRCPSVSVSRLEIYTAVVYRYSFY